MSSSFKYTLTKLRTLPSSLKICLRRSGNCAVKLASARPTVSPVTVTESCLPVNWRRGVGIRILAISVNQLLFVRFGLVGVRQPGIGVVELAFLNRQHDERIPRTGMLQIGFGKISAAIGMRMVNADQRHVPFARRLIVRQQILIAQLIIARLLARERIV